MGHGDGSHRPFKVVKWQVHGEREAFRCRARIGRGQVIMVFSIHWWISKWGTLKTVWYVWFKSQCRLSVSQDGHRCPVSLRLAKSPNVPVFAPGAFRAKTAT